MRWGVMYQAALRSNCFLLRNGHTKSVSPAVSLSQQICRTLSDSVGNDQSETKLVSHRRLRKKRLQENRSTPNTNVDGKKLDINYLNRDSIQQFEELTKKTETEGVGPSYMHEDVDFPSDREKYLNWKRQQSRHSFRPKVDPSQTSVILFPGQGSQFVGMGSDLLDYPNVLEIYKTAQQVLGFDLLNLCLNGPKSEIDRTVNCQLAVFATSLAAVEKLRVTKPSVIENCVATAGFSVGEYAALVFAGALSLEDALVVLKARAGAMQEASEQVASGMMSVFCGRESKLGLGMVAAKEHCQKYHDIEDPVCVVANYLCPEVKVVAGHLEALSFLQSHARDLQLKRLKLLPVSGAFHTQLMRSAKEPVEQALKMVEIRNPLIPVHCNVSSMPYKGEKMIQQMLLKQIYKPVKWEQTMHVIYSRSKGENFPSTIEAGPGRQLGSILKQINSQAYKTYSNISVGLIDQSSVHATQ